MNLLEHFIDDVTSEEDESNLHLGEEEINVFGGVFLYVIFQVGQVLAHGVDPVEHG